MEGAASAALMLFAVWATLAWVASGKLSIASVRLVFEAGAATLIGKPHV